MRPCSRTAERTYSSGKARVEAGLSVIVIQGRSRWARASAAVRRRSPKRRGVPSLASCQAPLDERSTRCSTKLRRASGGASADPVAAPPAGGAARSTAVKATSNERGIAHFRCRQGAGAMALGEGGILLLLRIVIVVVTAGLHVH